MLSPVFRSLEEYGARFTDAAFWRPYVVEVCRRHDIGPGERVRTGLPGSHPVFVVDERWVVKLFSDMFSGEESFAIEREVSLLLSQAPSFPAPPWVAEGALFPAEGGWRWPYLVFPLVPGRSLGEVWDEVSRSDREAIARDLGRWLTVLHHLPLDSASVLRSDWEPFAAWLGRQRAAVVERHRGWGSLPPALIAQLEAYLPPVDALLDRSRPPLLLHADMNADHLLGELRDGRWVSSGIIDFGDAKAGDLFYELVALHLGLFRGDMSRKREPSRAPGGLLRLFLDVYGCNAAAEPGFAVRAMAFTLLHEFDVLGESFARRPALREAFTLTELAHHLWELG